MLRPDQVQVRITHYWQNYSCALTMQEYVLRAAVAASVIIVRPGELVYSNIRQLWSDVRGLAPVVAWCFPLGSHCGALSKCFQTRFLSDRLRLPCSRKLNSFFLNFMSATSRQIFSLSISWSVTTLRVRPVSGFVIEFIVGTATDSSVWRTCGCGRQTLCPVLVWLSMLHPAAVWAAMTAFLYKTAVDFYHSPIHLAIYLLRHCS